MRWLQKPISMFAGCFLMIYGINAQDTTQTAGQTAQEVGWYGQPWIWVVAGAVLLLLLVTLLRVGPKPGAGDQPESTEKE